MKKILLVFLCMLFCFPSVSLADDSSQNVFVFNNFLHGEVVSFDFGFQEDDFYFYTLVTPVSQDELNFSVLDAPSYFLSVDDLNGNSYTVECSYFVDDNGVLSIMSLDNSFEFAFGILDDCLALGIAYVSLDYSEVCNLRLSLFASFDGTSNPPNGSSDADNSILDDSLGWAGEIVLWILSIFSSLLGFMVSNSICLIGLVIALVGIAFVYLRNTLGG